MLPWADGIVCGALTDDADIDVSTMHRLIHAANGKPFTFHRAFDVCRNPIKAIDQIIESGCDRVLTSGQQPTAEQGIELLCQLQEYAAKHIVIMPGGGVNSGNARRILDITKCHEIHGSASLGTGATQEAEVRRIIASLE
jgi:copper homeostasis protein